MRPFSSLFNLPYALTQSGLRPFATMQRVESVAIATPHVPDFVLAIRNERGTPFVKERSVFAFILLVFGTAASVMCGVGVYVMEMHRYQSVLDIVTDAALLVCSFVAIGCAVPTLMAAAYSRVWSFNRSTSRVVVQTFQLHRKPVTQEYAYAELDIILCDVRSLISATVVNPTVGIVVVASDQAMILAIHESDEVITAYCNEIESHFGIKIRKTTTTILMPTFWYPFVQTSGRRSPP